LIVKVSVTNTPEEITGADALFVTARSADGLAAEAGTDAVRDVARADAETRASPFLNARERRNMLTSDRVSWPPSFTADRMEADTDVGGSSRSREHADTPGGSE
jgi:hypothetical protein